jgi:hypothetical protein
MVYDEHLHRHFLRLQFESKLRLQGAENIGKGRLRLGHAHLRSRSPEGRLWSRRGGV